MIGESRIPVLSPSPTPSPPTPVPGTSSAIPQPIASKASSQLGGNVSAAAKRAVAAGKANAKAGASVRNGGRTASKRTTTLMLSSVDAHQSANPAKSHTLSKRNASSVFGSSRTAPVAAATKAAQSRRNESTLFQQKSYTQPASAVAANARRNQSTGFR